VLFEEYQEAAKQEGEVIFIPNPKFGISFFKKAAEIDRKNPDE
jgi:hypothetical protein